MTRQLTYLLVVDGGTDRALIPIVDWAIHRLDPHVEILEPDFRKRDRPVMEFVETLESGAMIVFVHRDGENAAFRDRMAEFKGIQRGDVVPIVPIRMTEAWLLVSGAAIARAADHPDAAVSLPPASQLENLADPKRLLEDLLLDAAGNPTGRRRKRFRSSLVERRINIASLVGDFSPLEELDAFRQFQAELALRYPYRHLL